MFKVGDKVHVLDNAESCCFAEDRGQNGVIVKIKNPEHLIVKSSKGEWAHCSKCITYFTENFK
jgi:hypothetical protein